MNKNKAVIKYGFKYPFVHTYEDPDRCVTLHEDDRDLPTVNIQLPDPPDWEHIDGWGLPKEEQVFKRLEQPQRLKELEDRFDTIEEIWNHIHNNVTLYRKEIEFIQKVIYHRIFGYWCFINGKPTYITNYHFLYLNFWNLDTGLPDYRDRDRKWFVAWWDTEIDPMSLGMISVKHRRAGDSYRAGCVNYFRITGMMNANGGIQSKNEPDAEKVFTEHIIKPWKRLPFYLKPSYTGQETPQSEIKFSAPTGVGFKTLSTGVRGSKVGAPKGLDSYINYKSQDPYAYDGRKLHFFHGDEWGKIKLSDVNETWKTVRRCLAQGPVVHGKALITTTVEEMEAQGGREFEQLCLNSLWGDVGANKTTKTGLRVVFIPADEGLDNFVGPYGESITGAPDEFQLKYLVKKNPVLADIYLGHIGARQYLLNERAEYAKVNDVESLLDHRRKFPLFFKEAFSSAKKNSGFNIPLLEKRVHQIKTIEKQLLRVGNFHRVDENNFYSDVYFEDDPQGRFMISYMPPEGQRNRRYKTSDGHYAPADPQFIACSDPFKYRTTGYSKRSKAGFAIFMPRDPAVDTDTTPLDQWQTNRFVCDYIYRTETNELFADDCLMACVFYGAMMFPEINVTAVWDYFEDNQFGGYLKYAFGPDGRPKKTPGFTTVNTGKTNIGQLMFDLVRTWIEKHACHEVHYRILQTFIDIKDTSDITNYDLFVGAAGCLIGARYHGSAIGGYNPDETDLTDYVEVFEVG